MTRSELIARVEALTGPDRDVDFAIHSHFFPTPKRQVSNVELPPGFGSDALSMAMDPRPRYTASIDAAVALVERVRPGWMYYYTGRDDEGQHYAQLGEKAVLYEPSETGWKGSWSKGPTLPVAIVLALLRSLPEGE